MSGKLTKPDLRHVDPILLDRMTVPLEAAAYAELAEWIEADLDRLRAKWAHVAAPAATRGGMPEEGRR